MDATSVHPESYEAARKLLARMGMQPEQILDGTAVIFIQDYRKMAAELGIGEITLRDIEKELKKPGRDPRDEMPQTDPPHGRTGDERPERGNGPERNRGAMSSTLARFVDIGVHQDGLVAYLADHK